MKRLAAALAVAVFVLSSAPSRAQEWRRSDSPYRMGEEYAEVPATCETIGRWIDHAPKTDDRFSLTMVGRLVSVDWDGALAYLVACEEPGVQVMCVTYSAEGRSVGETVTIAGGFVRVDERRIMLDPCLASEDQ